MGAREQKQIVNNAHAIHESNSPCLIACPLQVALGLSGPFVQHTGRGELGDDSFGKPVIGSPFVAHPSQVACFLLKLSQPTSTRNSGSDDLRVRTRGSES